MTIRVDTVSGAAKREQLVTEAPSSVTVVTAHEIATYGWRTLADVLRATRSFYVTYDRNYAYLGARGFGRPTDYNNRVLVLVNGHRLNDNVYDATGVGTDFPIDLALVDRIEIIRGPGSALYGTSAFFAVVDVITRSAAARSGRRRGQPRERELQHLALARIVRHHRRQGPRPAAVGLAPDERWRRHAAASPSTTTRSTGPALSRGADGDRASSLFASVRLGRLSLEGATSRTREAPPDRRLGHDARRPARRRRSISARGSAPPGAATGDAPSVTARAFYDHMRYDGTYVVGRRSRTPSTPAATGSSVK